MKYDEEYANTRLLLQLQWNFCNKCYTKTNDVAIGRRRVKLLI